MPKRDEFATSRSDSHLFSRRDFVTRTSLIGAGLVVGTSLWAGCSTSVREVRSTTGTGAARGSNKMKTRQLGTLQVSEIGAGAMSISANYGPPADRGEGHQGPPCSPRKGVTFFDTAEVYGPYTNEELVGEALAPIRDKVASRRSSASTSKAARRAEQPAGAHQEGGRGLAQAPHAPTGSTSTTSIASIRTCRSRTWPVRSRS